MSWLMNLFRNRVGVDVDLNELRHAYRRVAARVWSDLAVYCYANDPAPRDGDLYKLGLAAGRRDVWLHINEFLTLKEEEVVDLYKGRSIVFGD